MKNVDLTAVCTFLVSHFRFLYKRKECDFMEETKDKKEPRNVLDRFTQELDKKQRKEFEKLTQKQKLAVIKDYLRKY